MKNAYFVSKIWNFIFSFHKPGDILKSMSSVKWDIAVKKLNFEKYYIFSILHNVNLIKLNELIFDWNIAV